VGAFLSHLPEEKVIHIHPSLIFVEFGPVLSLNLALVNLMSSAEDRQSFRLHLLQ
jgi:hypothetical protein